MRRTSEPTYWFPALAVVVFGTAGCAARPTPPGTAPPATPTRLAGEVMAGPGSVGNADGGS